MLLWQYNVSCSCLGKHMNYGGGTAKVADREKLVI